MKNKKVSTTYVNHYKVFFDVLEYLYSKGHKRIGYSIGRKAGTISQYRERAYRDFHKKYDLPYNSYYIMDECLYLEDGEK
jgi:DNA-binding LacI/PurR family transcriptional regulator